MIPAAIDDCLLRRLWNRDDLTIMDIAWEVGAFHREVLERARKLGLPARRFAMNPGAPDPTQQEIAERAAAIRQTRWMPEEVEVRRVGPGTERWDVPVVGLRLY